MKHAQKPDHISLNTIISWLKEKRFVIPDFQREFEWRPGDVNELMKSIFLDYYIGNLLLWKARPETVRSLSCEAVYGHEGTNNAEYIVLDGQQRLTAISYCFLAPDKALPNRSNAFRYFIRVDAFMNENYDDAFEYEWATRRLAKLDNADLQYAQHLFPLAVIGKGGWKIYDWIQGYEKFWSGRAQEADTEDDGGLAQKHAVNVRGFGDVLRGITEEYQISYIELDRDIAVAKVCDIFTQINSRGVQLDTFDLMNALLKPQDLRLKEMWRKAKARLEFADTERMNVYILQVMSVLLQGYCSPKYLYFLLPGSQKPIRDPDGKRRTEVLVSDIVDFRRRWDEAVDALEAVMDLLRHPQEFGVSSARYIPYVSMLPATAALLAHAKKLAPGRQLEANRKLRQWYWASVFQSRYSGSVESTTARDFLDVKGWMENDGTPPALIEEFRTQFRNVDFRNETKRGSSVYNGIFNLLVIHGARDWRTGAIPKFDDLDDHHIVPKSWGSKNGKAPLIDSILNRTPLTAETNRNVIGDQLPNVYLPKLFAQSNEAAVRGLLESHFISPAALEILLRNPFTADDFELFIQERQRTLQEAIESLLIKERLNLEPSMRELDGRVERVELWMRRFIAEKLGDDPSQLPQHVQQKLEERIGAAIKKNPALEQDHFKQLGPRMEYADLRELQDVIGAKDRWQDYAPTFVNRETLTQKFDKLSDLRNAIRHSRTASEITRKEGEAALIWFETVLKIKRITL